MKVTAKKSALKKFIDEAITSANPAVINEPQPDALPINANPIVADEDLTAPSDPPVDDPEFVPTNSIELAASLDRLARRIAPELIADFYAEFVKLMERAENGLLGQTEEQPGLTVPKLNVEEAMRIKVREMIAEAWGDAPDKFIDDEDKEEDEEEEEEDAAEQEEIDEKSTFEEIMKYLGFTSARGAKAIVDRTLEKFSFLWKMQDQDPAKFDEFVLSLVAGYIKQLASTGELDAEDIAMLKAHPDMVSELDGFREYAHKYVKRGMRDTGREEKREKRKLKRK